MSITVRDPRTIHLGGSVTLVNDRTVSEAVTPGHLVELNAGQYRKHASAAAATTPAFALNMPELNKSYDDAYAATDQALIGIGAPGSTFLAWLASGQNVADGARLESAGGGLLTALAAGVLIATAIEAKNATAGDSRIRIEVA